MLVPLFIPFLILASPPVYDSEAAYNKTNSASKETRRRSRTSRANKNINSKVNKKLKRTTRRFRRRNPKRNKAKYQLKVRRKAGGTFTRRQNSRATNNTTKRVRKKTTNKKRRLQRVQDSIQHRKGKGNPSKKSARRRSPGHLSPLQREMLRYQMHILLSDPEMGPIYRQILKDQKN